MSQEDNLSPADRLVALMDHLGVGTAHFGTAIPRDISGMAVEHPERLAGIVLCVPSRLDPAPLTGIADRVLMISGERGPAAEATARAAARLPAAERSVLAGYEAPAAGATPSPSAPRKSPNGSSRFSAGITPMPRPPHRKEAATPGFHTKSRARGPR